MLTMSSLSTSSMGLSGFGTELNVHMLAFYLSPLLYTVWKSLHKWLVSTMLMTYVSMHNIQWSIFQFQGRICSTCELPSMISMICRKCPLVWGLILLTLELLKEFAINASDVWTDIISWIPTHHELRPLLGGVNWLSFRVRLIDRCWKRKRWKGPHSNRLSRSALLRKQSRDTMCWNHGWSSTSTAPKSEIKGSEGAINSFLYLLDVL